MIRLYHNPRCTTSRKALAILESSGVDFATILYLKEPPTRAQLVDLVGRLDDPPADLVRKDKRFRDLGLDPADYETAEEVVEVLVDHPELMQRPLIDDGARVAIGRPLDRLDAFTES